MLLKSKSSFRRTSSGIVKTQNWVERAKGGETIEIPKTMQQNILAGFQKFYPKNSPKRVLVEEAIGLRWGLDSTKKSGCFILIGPSGETTVSTKCTPPNIESDIKQACRGAILMDQIMPLKTRKNTEIDHYNKGGFKKIYEDWRKKNSTEYLTEYVIKNSVLKGNSPFYTFKEPVLSDWQTYHRKHALLQELSSEEHVLITNQRRLLDYNTS